MSNGDLEKLLSKRLMSLFKNRPVFEFLFYRMITGLFKNNDFQYTNHISSWSKMFKLASLNINNIQDLIKEAIPTIYYMVIWIENHLENNLTCLDKTINFAIKLVFYENYMVDDKHFEPEGITAVKIENLEEDEDEDILTKIKNCINEELEKSD